MIYQANVGLRLGQRRRRWTNIKLTLVQCVVLTGIVYDCSNDWLVIKKKNSVEIQIFYVTAYVQLNNITHFIFY